MSRPPPRHINTTPLSPLKSIHNIQDDAEFGDEGSEEEYLEPLTLDETTELENQPSLLFPQNPPAMATRIS
ncbi:hypothetical protein ScalyP_jg8778 [Parmales sp. scaly parma]|nr:hypothetical protein ScalyP_jg8778 [Parmales sp. scaly parma]